MENGKPVISRLIRLTALIFGLSFLLILDASNRDFGLQWLNIASAVFFGMVSLAWLIAGQRRPTPLALPVGIYLAVYALAVVFSVDPRRSLTEFLFLSLTLFLFSLAHDLTARGWPFKLILQAVLIVGGVAMGFSWIGVADFFQRYWALPGSGFWPDFAYRLSAPNVQAWNLNVLILLAAGWLLNTRVRLTRFVLAGYILSGLALLFFSSSRSGWLGTAAGMALLGLLFLRQKGISLRAAAGYLRSRRLLALLAAAAGFLFIIGLGFLLYQQAVHPSHSSFIESRQGFWKSAILTIRADPLLGQGPFTFATALARTQSIPVFGIYLHSHSLPLTLTAETGFIGLAAFLFLFAAAVRQLWRAYQEAGPDLRLLIAGLLAALTAASVHSLFDTLIGKTLGLWALVIAAGALLGSRPQTGSIPRARPWWTLLIVLALAVAAWLMSPYAAARQLASRGDWQGAVAAYRLAVKRDAFSAASHQQLGMAYARLAASGSQDALPLAVAEFRRAVELDPDWALHRANLAALLDASGDDQASLSSWQAAVQKAPQSWLFQFNLGLAAERIGDRDLARRAYAEALRLEPLNASSSFWRSNSFRQKTLADWQAGQEQAAEPAEADLRARLAENPFDLRARNALIERLIQTNRLEEAQTSITLAELAGSDRPYWLADLQWQKSSLAAARGDLALAASNGLELLAQFADPGSMGPGNRDGAYYIQSAFRVPAAPVDLVPQMPYPIPGFWEARFLKLMDWCQALNQPSCSSQVRAVLRTRSPDLPLP